MKTKSIHSVYLWFGFLLSLGVVAWKQILSGFTLITGDGYDGTIENVIATHWYWVINGERIWNEVGYFYPYKDTLGYNDAYFIYGVIASVYRIFIENQFVAVELAHLTIRLIGFFTFYRLSRYLNITKTSSILASSVFTVFYSTTHTGHAQLLLVGMSPLLMYLAAKSFNNFNKTKFYKYAALSSLTYGAMALTGFYVTYFTTLYLIVFSLIYLCINRRAVEFLFTKQSIKKIIIWSTFAVLSLIPFLVVYLQKLKETGGHPYSEIKKHLPKLQDIVNIGDHSLLWGSSLTELLTGSRFQFSEGELKLGFGLVFFICFIFASLYILIKYTNNIDDKKEAKWVAIAISTIILIFSVIDFGIGSLWKNVYSYVPGGKGLRVVSRIYIFLSLPATLVIFKVIDDLLKASGTIHKNISLALVVLFIFIEQINTAPFVALDAKEQFSFLKELPIPPQECKVFYAKNPSGFSFDDPNVDSYYRVNVRAMLVSAFFNIPTIIGVASFAPPDWNFTYDPPGTFDERVLKYAQKHDIHKDLCVLDITNKSWSKI